MTRINLNIFKAYDIRGIVPQELDEDTVFLIGKAVVEYLKPKEVAVGRDMRLSSDKFFQALASGITSQGADVIDIGQVSTDALYFTVGKFGYDCGIMITASHNPKEYNGMKICQKDAIPLSGDKGLKEIKEIILQQRFSKVSRKGKIALQNVIPDYIQHLLTFVEVKKIKPYKIVIDAGNGMAGKIIPDLFQHLPCQLIPMFFELDGSFPHHLASPIEPENMVFLQKKLLEEKADLGAAFDGDADRMFLVDEKAQRLGGDIVTALVSKAILKKEKNATILYNLICSKAVPKVIRENGGIAVRTRVGHALIKPLMKQYNAVFGGEHSGHFYFRRNWYADSGMIALLVCLEAISQENKLLSQIVKSIDPYYRSGEINTYLSDISKKIAEIKIRYQNGKVDELDGITVEFPDWWFNLRPSNTEPLLRLNIEASSPELLEEKKSELLKLINS